MGISGLLPLLRPVTRDSHLSDLKGKVVGVDMYSWIHKGVYSCSKELCLGEPTDKYITYCLKRVGLLRDYSVQPYLVFDGGYLPAKKKKELERRLSREKSKREGIQHHRESRSKDAHAAFAKAVEVTPFMAYRVMQAVKQHFNGVEMVVAPYEADAQLGFLATRGIIDAVITEDSDMMLFGCPRILFKLETAGSNTGALKELIVADIFTERNDELDMRGLGVAELRLVCVLSGCDYVPSVPGIALKKALGHLKSNKFDLNRAIRDIKRETKGALPEGYEYMKDYSDDVERAILTWQHQRVFDVTAREVVHLTPIGESFEAKLQMKRLTGAETPFVGAPMEQEHACAVADGLVDPITGDIFIDVDKQAAATSEGQQLKADKIPAVPKRAPKKLAGQSKTLKSWLNPVTSGSKAKAQAERTKTATATAAAKPAPIAEPAQASGLLSPSPSPSPLAKLQAVGSGTFASIYDASPPPISPSPHTVRRSVGGKENSSEGLHSPPPGLSKDEPTSTSLKFTATASADATAGCVRAFSHKRKGVRKAQGHQGQKGKVLRRRSLGLHSDGVMIRTVPGPSCVEDEVAQPQAKPDMFKKFACRSSQAAKNTILPPSQAQAQASGHLAKTVRAPAPPVEMFAMRNPNLQDPAR